MTLHGVVSPEAGTPGRWSCGSGRAASSCLPPASIHLVRSTCHAISGRGLVDHSRLHSCASLRAWTDPTGVPRLLLSRTATEQEPRYEPRRTARSMPPAREKPGCSVVWHETRPPASTGPTTHQIGEPQQVQLSLHFRRVYNIPAVFFSGSEDVMTRCAEHA